MTPNRKLTFVVLAIALVAALAMLLSQPGGAVEPLDSQAETSVVEGMSAPTEPAPLEDSLVDAVAAEAQSSREAIADPTSTLRVSGIVIADPEGTPIAGAEITVGFVSICTALTGTHPPQRTDSDGRFSFDASFHSSWRDPEFQTLPVEVRLSVWAPGFVSEEHKKQLEVTEQAAAEFELSLIRGVEVSGFVYSTESEPVNADVMFYSTRGEVEHIASSDSDGFYEGILHRGRQGRFVARASGLGTAQVANIQIDPMVRNRIPDLYLSGTGVLAGIVVDPEGNPIGFHRLTALPEEMVTSGENPETWKFTEGVSEHDFAAERGDGLLFDATETNSSGQFRFEGLRPGRYAVFAASDLGAAPVRTKDRLFPTGVLDAELVIEVYRISVKVESSELPRTVQCTNWSSEGEPAFGGARKRNYEAVGQNPTVFHVRKGRKYLIGLYQRNAHAFRTTRQTEPGPWKSWSAERVVEVTPDRYLTEVVFGEAGPTSTIVLDVDDSEASSAFLVAIHSRTLGQPVRVGLVASKDLPLTIELPPGQYRMNVSVAVVTTLPGMHHGHLYPDSTSRSNELTHRVESGWKEIDLSEGELARAEFQFMRGGRLLVGQRIRAGSPAVRPGTFRTNMPQLVSRSLREQRDFEIVDSEGARTRHFNFFLRPGFKPQTTEFEPARIWRELDRALPAGSYLFRWRNEAAEILEARFTIRVGETTSLKLD